MAYQPIFAEPPHQSEPSRTLSDDDFTVPIEDRYFEDYKQGAVYEYGYYEVEEAEVVDFARRFDPQAFHTDPEAAARSQFGGLIASGWHVGSIIMRLFADHYLTKVASLASPGLDELRWSAPVRPGDRLKLRTTIVETQGPRARTRADPGRPDRRPGTAPDRCSPESIGSTASGRPGSCSHALFGHGYDWP